MYRYCRICKYDIFRWGSLILNVLCRYLKNVFPKVDEYILLDTLEQCDNNVQKATDKLLDLGYEKRDPTAPSRASIKKKEEEEKVSVSNFQ